MDDKIKHVLKHHASQGVPLTFEEAHELMLYALAGCDGNTLAQIQSIAALCALHHYATYRWRRDGQDTSIEKRHGHQVPESAAEQIAGVCAAVFEEDIGRSEFGFLDPKIDWVTDNSGMGGDLVMTPNVSTIAAFIAAAAGIPICKHGSPANTDQGRYGNSDFISIVCGINPYAKKREVRESICNHNFGFTDALDTRYKRIHTQTHSVAHLPHMNDIIGPITNPISPSKLTRRVLGVNHLIPPKVVAEAYKILNLKGITHLDHGLFVRGYTGDSHYDGIDEISVCDAGTQVAELIGGEIREFHWQASDFGIDPVPVSDIMPLGDKGQYSMALLKGEVGGPRLHFILANAAVLFYIVGRSSDMKECYEMAGKTFFSGKPYELMLSVRETLSK